MFFSLFPRTETCGTTIFSNATGIISSPGYPSNYPNGANCSYTIEIGDDLKVLELDVFALDIEESIEHFPDCPFDWLDIGGRKICGNMTQTISAHYCNKSTPKEYRDKYASSSDIKIFRLFGS